MNVVVLVSSNIMLMSDITYNCPILTSFVDSFFDNIYFLIAFVLELVPSVLFLSRKN